MNKQQQQELCTLLAKLLVDINRECNDVIYDKCDFGFTILDQRIIAHIKFEMRDLNE